MRTTASFVLWISVLALLISGFVAGADDIDLSVSLDNSEIEPGDDFTLELELTNEESTEIDDVDLDIIITVDGIAVYEDDERGVDIDVNDSTIITIDSEDFDVDGEDIWEKSLMGYSCGEFDIKVSVSGDDVKTVTDTLQLEISGEKIKVTIDPEEPSGDEAIEFLVRDDDNSPMDGATVRLTRLGDNGNWDYDDEFREKETDDGEVTFEAVKSDSYFKKEPYSEYKADIYDNGFCLYTESFEILNLLEITEVPTSLYAGEESEVRIADSEGNWVGSARLTISGKSGLVGSYNSDDRGYVSFSVQSQGSYTFLATKSGYSNSEAINIEVSARKGTSIQVSPREVSVGKNVEISVSSDGNPLSGAEVAIKRPDGKTDVRTTSSTGKVTYSPEVYGPYELVAEKEGYEPAEGAFEAVNLITVELPDEPMILEDITLKVKNQDAEPIGGASVRISGTSGSGSTDSNGEYVLRVDEAKEYLLEVEKEGFETYSEKVTFYGLLQVTQSAERIDLGDTITLSFKNTEGEMIEASVSVIRPDGREDVAEKSSFSYTPEIGGNYSFTVEKAFYKTESGSFQVTPYDLELNSWVSGSDLVVKATSNGKAVGDVAISIFTPAGEEKSLLTDEEGLARLDAEALNQTGVFKVSATDPRYEKESLEKEITGFGGSILPLVGIFVALIAVLVVVLGVTFFLGHRHSKKESFGGNVARKERRKNGSGLGNI